MLAMKDSRTNTIAPKVAQSTEVVDCTVGAGAKTSEQLGPSSSPRLQHRRRHGGIPVGDH